MTPVPSSRSAPAAAYNSSMDAALAGNGRPSIPTWRGLRSNDTPSAPSSSAVRRAERTASISAPAASRSCDSSPITQRRIAECPAIAP